MKFVAARPLKSDHPPLATWEKLHAYCNRLVAEFHPERIVLFGSFGTEFQRWDSDVDLLVVMPFECRPLRKAIEVRLALDAGFPLDLVLRTPDAVATADEGSDWLLSQILNTGRVIYEIKN